MAEVIRIEAESRDVVGKSAHKLAPGGRLPAVMYGADTAALPISVDKHVIELFLRAHGGGSTLVQISVGGAKPVNAIVKEVQHDPVKGTLQHIDFWAVKMTQVISATVPLHFVGDAVGVKAGGVLTHNLNELHIDALPTAIPDAIEADISKLEVGDSIHVGDLAPPHGVTITTSADEIVCSVTPPTVAPAEEEAAEVEQPEVVGETKEEEEEE